MARKKSETATYSCRVTVRYKPAELAQLNKQFKATTSKKLGEYIRKVSLQKPVSVLHRNQSADDFLAEMVQLKNELNAIGHNFNQVVKKLHTLSSLPEIKAWLELNETAKQNFLKKVHEIESKISEIYQQWLQG